MPFFKKYELLNDNFFIIKYQNIVIIILCKFNFTYCHFVSGKKRKKNKCKCKNKYFFHLKAKKMPATKQNRQPSVHKKNILKSEFWFFCSSKMITIVYFANVRHKK